MGFNLKFGFFNCLSTWCNDSNAHARSCLHIQSNIQHLHEMLQLLLENFIHSLKNVLVAFFSLNNMINHSLNLPFVIVSNFLMFSFAIKICQKPNYRFKTLKMHEHSIVLTHCPFVGSRDNIFHKNALYCHAWWVESPCMHV